MEAIQVSINRVMDKDDMAHIYDGLYSAMKKNKIMPFAVMWIDPEIIILSEI